MAKGKKKTPKAAPEKEAKKTKANAAPPKAKGSLLKTFLPGIIGGVISVTAAIVGIYTVLIQTGGEQTQQAYARAQAHGYLQAISQQALQLQALANSTANSSAVKKALKEMDESTITAVESNLEQIFPNVANVEIYAKGKARKDRKAEPPISFAQLDMVTRAEKEEKHQPEIHPYGKSRFLSVVAPIKDGNNVIGSLFATYDLMVATRHLPAVQNDWGFLELVQKFANNPPLVFHSSGNQASKQGTAQIAEGPLATGTPIFTPALPPTFPPAIAQPFLLSRA